MNDISLLTGAQWLEPHSEGGRGFRVNPARVHPSSFFISSAGGRGGGDSSGRLQCIKVEDIRSVLFPPSQARTEMGNKRASNTKPLCVYFKSGLERRKDGLKIRMTILGIFLVFAFLFVLTNNPRRCVESVCAAGLVKAHSRFVFTSGKM